MNKALLCAALAGVVAMAAAPAHAEDAMMSKVKCFGIAKAGKNACKSMTGAHSCAGQAKVDNDPNEFVLADSAATCTAEGGKVMAK